MGNWFSSGEAFPVTKRNKRKYGWIRDLPDHRDLFAQFPNWNTLTDTALPYPSQSVDAISGGTRSVDISEMCKIVDIFNDECNTLNKKIYELVNECNELKEQNTSLIRSLQYCHLRMSKSDESTHRRRTRRFMSMPIQTGIGVAFYGTALAAASVEDRTLVVSPKRKKPHLVAGSEL